MAETGITNIRGKEYQSVALRVSKFRDAHPLHSLTTSIVNMNAECVVMQAQVADETGAIKATGHAEEYRASSQINKTSALENCETSAIGRALAAFGFGGTEFATANEVVNAIHQQNAPANDANERINNPVPHERTKPEKLAGPLTSKTALKTAIKGLIHNINGCGDGDELHALLNTKEAVAVIEQCKRDAPDWHDGYEGAPAEFVPLAELIAKATSDFELIDNTALRAG